MFCPLQHSSVLCCKRLCLKVVGLQRCLFKVLFSFVSLGLYERSLVDFVNKEIFDSLSSGRNLSSFSDDELVYDSLSLNCVPTPPTKRHKRSR